MSKAARWTIAVILTLLTVIIITIIIRWEKIPWSPGYDPGPAYIPPSAEVLSSPTPFPPSQITPTEDPELVWIDPQLPEIIRESAAQLAGAQLTDTLQGAAGILGVVEGEHLLDWVLVLAAPFPTIEDGLTLKALKSAWQDGQPALAGVDALLMSQETRDILSLWWDEPAPGVVEIFPQEELEDAAWSSRPSLALLPYHQLTPSWKVLRVDGSSPLDDDFDPGAYPLSIPISVQGFQPDGFADLSGNRDPERITSVIMTGVTALVRATAWTMEIEGLLYPAQDLKPWLEAADILHISNEVPFVRGCPYPDPGQVGLRFCSDIRYLELLVSIGTDVVELTGDHFGDYGPEAMLYTLEVYQDQGWPYYGGGATSQEAQTPVLFEHNGNRIAFLGCNAKGGGYATAGPGYPGAVACDFDLMTRQIRELRQDGYLPIATFQHFEYYTYRAQPDQVRDARRLASAGAVIVSGSQAHQPQGFEISSETFIHHGLGNLFFDQIYEIPPHTASAFIDRHIFYNGKHISTELLTIKFLDFARARPMTPQERENLLRTTFAASEW